MDVPVPDDAEPVETPGTSSASGAAVVEHYEAEWDTIEKCGGGWDPWLAGDGLEHEFLDKWGYTKKWKEWKFAELKTPRGQ